MNSGEARERAPAMEREVNFTGGGQVGSTRALARVLRHGFGRTVSVVLVGAAWAAAVLPRAAYGQASAPSAPGHQSLSSRGAKAPANPIRQPLRSHPAADRPVPPAPAPLATTTAADARPGEYKRYKVRVDEFGDCVVARFHGQYGDQTALILPDGQLGSPSRLVPTEEPFQPLTADQLRTLLHQGPYAEYQVLKTEHYLIFYKSTTTFAQNSGRLLEDLYHGLIDAFRRNKIPVHDSEFPLVAVIFATEGDFRDHKNVDPQVQAYYEFGTNRIFFYETSDRDRFEPKVAALLKPQTVAHEGAHQILSNIGVQPRPCAWPIWLVEGLAEYCATTVNTRKGISWSGMGAINSLHMATIRELEDPFSNQINGPEGQAVKVSRSRSTTHAESLMIKTNLTPVDYAQAWALTHYLAQKRGTDFVKFLEAMKRIPPLVPRTPADNLAEFRKFFSEPPAKLDKSVDDHIHRLSQKKTYDSLFYYAVIFQQALGNGVVRRAATVSQSPQFIQQWVQEMTSPQGDVPSWEASPWPTRSRAFNAIRNWMQNP
jgi:hypothetical protein